MSNRKQALVVHKVGSDGTLVTPFAKYGEDYPDITNLISGLRPGETITITRKLVDLDKLPEWADVEFIEL